MNISDFNTQAVNDVANLCQNDETRGFDIEAGQSWIYPTNYSLRDYQFNIIQQALHKNTLVSLPTGLGKTFIAAVVMYNFYRWYPNYKVIFMAPTRPLVKQQMDACYNITGIAQEVTAELTGCKDQQSRKEIWQNKRVFFITPQVLQNDLSIIIELGEKIKCLVFDEAHRAKGNHAYCEVIRKLLPKNKFFRVLALSATPGNSSRSVIEVMQNLLIAHVEFRSEESPDVKPYVFERALETVVVPLGERLQQIKDDYIQILEKYTRTLIKYKVIYGNCTNLTKGGIFMIMKEFQAKNQGNRNSNYAEIMKNLNICVTLYHAYETLIRCGLRAFLNFYEEHINNPLLSGNATLRQILNDLKHYLGPNPDVKPLPDGTFTKIPPNTKFGHPKFYKLQDILLTHFQNADASTRIIVFFEYRESVAEAYALLSKSYPKIRARIFVGQGSGVTQKDQINTVRAFREGSCNTLLSTCIGEEGLDVGDVDLIVCFDVANKSPIRMIQRMGRTGRKKEGRVVVLVTEGKEQQTLKDCLIYKSNLGSFISNPDQLEHGKYRDNPKLIPPYVEPKCQKMYITVKKPTSSKNLKDMFKKMTAEELNLGDFEIVEIKEKLNTNIQNLFDKREPLDFDLEIPKIHFSKYLEKQRSFQAPGVIKKSKQSEIFVSLLQFADSKRYNLPTTQQIGTFGDFSRNKILKQGDIRSMFSKAPPITLSQESNISNSQFNLDKEKDITHSFPEELFDEISAFLSIEISKRPTCETCDFLFECPKLTFRETEKIDVSSWLLPDLAILESITATDLENFSQSLTPKSKKSYEDLMDMDNEFNNILGDLPDNPLCVNNKTLAYETPRNFDEILKNFQISETTENVKVAEKSLAYETPKSFAKVLNKLKIPECEPSTSTTKDQKTSNLQELLAFFKLNSLRDFFQNSPSRDDLVKTIPQTNHERETTSPDLFENSSDLFTSSETSVQAESPVLCSSDRLQNVKAKKRLFETSTVEEKPNLSNLKYNQNSFFESTRKKIIPNRCSIASDSFHSNNEKQQTVSFNKDKLAISELCDLSTFGLKNSIVLSSCKKTTKKQPTIQERLSNLEDFCEVSVFFPNFSKTLPLSINQKSSSDDVDFEQVCQPSSFFQQIDKTSNILNNKSDLSPDVLKTQSIKSPSQLGVTQMVSLIGKINDSTLHSDSQKENYLSPVLTTQKFDSSFKSETKKNYTPRSSQKKFHFKDATPKRKKISNISLAGDSDDEFQTISSPAFIKPKLLKTPKSKSHKASKSKSKKPTKFGDFIEFEAEVSDSEQVLVSDDEDSGQDAFEESFIGDETQDLNNTTLHAKYLESVKSPARRGPFKIPDKFQHDITDVYSQKVTQDNDSYLNDSFCVEDSGEENSSKELSELDILEEKLKEMAKKKKRKKSSDNVNMKRRRIVIPSDDSD